MNEALLLIVVWVGLFVVPGVVRARTTSPQATVGGFERAMNVLRSEPSAHGGGRTLMVPGDASRIVARPVDTGAAAGVSGPQDPVLARRRTWFVRGLLAVAVTFGLALLFGGAMWFAFLAAAGLTAAYVTVLRRLKLQRDQARQVVRSIEPAEEAAVPPVGQVAVGGDEAWVGSGTVRLRRWDG